MQMPHIVIHSKPAILGMQSVHSKLKIHQEPTQLSIEQPQAKLQITTVPTRVEIDETQAWNNLNLKSAFVRIREAAEKGYQDVLKGIARRSQEADQMMHIERKGNVFAEIARQHVFDNDGSFDTGDIPPMEAVKFNVEPGSLMIDWETHKPIIEAQSFSPEINYIPSKDNIYMIQYPSITIDVKGLYIDQKG